jgi:dTMP kinase
LDVDPKLGVERQVQAGGANRFEMENLAFHQEVREAYLYLAKQNDHARWELVDANQTLEVVEEVIWKKVAEILE